MKKGEKELRKCSIFEGTFDADGVQVTSGQDEFGREIPDPVPMEAPIDFTSGPSLKDMVRTMVRNENFQRLYEEEGFDTFEEASDFDVDDEMADPTTIYEAFGAKVVQAKSEPEPKPPGSAPEGPGPAGSPAPSPKQGAVEPAPSAAPAKPGG